MAGDFALSAGVAARGASAAAGPGAPARRLGGVSVTPR